MSEPSGTMRLEDRGTTTSRFERARLQIARLGLGDSEELSQVLGLACRISADALQVARVGVWLLHPDGVTLQRVEQYQAGAPAAGTEVLSFARGAPYLEAIRSRRVVQADDAQADPRTRELGPTYLGPLKIGAMLDAPIFRGGRVVGVVCHEHLGGPRAWSERDVHFAGAVADMLSGLFEQAARLEAEARLADALRMEALGRLAGAVAHDMNNVLTGVRLAAEALRRTPGDPVVVEQAARDVIEQAASGERLTRQLLAFCRGQPAAPVELELGQLLRHLEPALRRLIADRCDLRLALPAGPCRVRADRSQLEQVVTNLVVNARDASLPERRGLVTVILNARPGDPGQGKAILSVVDDGSGMTAEVRARAFEPYFTTRSAGTGMGLAIVYGLVQQAGGRVEVFSAPGQGATFVVTLPLLD